MFHINWNGYSTKRKISPRMFLLTLTFALQYDMKLIENSHPVERMTEHVHSKEILRFSQAILSNNLNLLPIFLIVHMDEN
jgi:hypothetical protein